MSDWLEEHVRTLAQLSGLDPQVAQSLFDRDVYISIDPAMRGNRTYRLAFAFAVTLLSRMFPRIRFDDLGPLPELILPWGEIPLPRTVDGASTVVLVFGRESPPGNWARVIAANCHDWRVHIDLPFIPDPNEEWNPVLALVTASYAAGRVTKILFGDAVDGPDTWKPFSILDFRNGRASFDWSEIIDVGNICLAGVGAVGTAALYALSAHNALSGTLTLVDHEVLEATNLGRYVLYDTGDLGLTKVSAAERKLRELGVRNPIVPVSERFEEFFDREYNRDPGFRVSRLISAPDRRRIRRQFQSKLPRQVWDASTGPDQVVLHRNSFDEDLACLACIYPETPEEDHHLRHVAETLNVAFERVSSGESISEDDAKTIAAKYPHLSIEAIRGKAFDSVFRELCSTGRLRAASAVVLAPFPFISGLAGALLYFEFIKSLRPDIFGAFQIHNYVHLNPMFPPNPDLRERRASRPDCFCQKSEVRALFSKLWTN
jgi:ThiF family